MRNSKPFAVRGAAFQANTRMGATLTQWFGPGFYQVTITSIPKSVYSRESAVSTKWTLTRNLKTCVLHAETIVVNCSQATPWALMEWGANVDLLRASFVQNRIAEDSWTLAKESDSRTPQDSPGVKLVLAQVGEKPVALLETKAVSVDTKSKDVEPFPFFHFDQSFLAPVSARWNNGQDWVLIQAMGDWETRRNRSRFTHVLASRIDINVNGVTAGSFTRGEREVLTGAAPRTPQAITDLSALESALSNEGQMFLKALLETH